MSRRSSRAEFERLMLPHLQSSYNLARWLLHDRADAEDAVQEAYLKAYRVFDSYAGGNCAACLSKIVRNTCLYTLRRKARGPKVVSIDRTVAHQEGGLHDLMPDALAIQPDTALGRETGRDRVREAVRQLPAHPSSRSTSRGCSRKLQAPCRTGSRSLAGPERSLHMSWPWSWVGCWSSAP